MITVKIVFIIVISSLLTAALFIFKTKNTPAFFYILCLYVLMGPNSTLEMFKCYKERENISAFKVKVKAVK